MAKWFLKRGEKESGPGTDDQLRAAFKKGAISADSLVRREDSTEWIHFKDAGILSSDEFNPFDQTSQKSANTNQGSNQPLFHSEMFQEKPTYGRSNPTYAPFIERFVALLIDAAVLFVASIVLSFIPFIGHIASFVLGIGYFIFLQNEWGYTFGRKIMKMHMETPDGKKPELGAFIIRYIASIFSGIILFIGYFLALGDAQVRTLHDRIAGTVVVKD